MLSTSIEKDFALCLDLGLDRNPALVSPSEGDKRYGTISHASPKFGVQLLCLRDKAHAAKMRRRPL